MNTTNQDLRVMLVDDDENLLSGFRRQIRGRFTASYAESPSRALELADQYGPFAVVVSDMKMPEMSGVELLSELRKRNQHTVGIILTGDADVTTAAKAVNQGSLFRFLNKPCPTDELLESIRLGMEHYRVVSSESELLEKTLAGSVKMLTQVMSMVMPDAFGMTQEAKSLTSAICEDLGVTARWQAEMAAMLMRIGMVSIPSETASRYFRGDKITPSELLTIKKSATQGQNLVSAIPRLGQVATFIGSQFEDGENDPPIESRILRVVGDYQRFSQNSTPLDSLRQLQSDSTYDPKVIESLQRVTKQLFRASAVPVQDLAEGMVLEADMLDSAGRLLLRKGTEIHQTLVQRINSMQESGTNIVQPIPVRYIDTNSPKPQLAGGAA
ncbi:MAG: HD domain-containing phosphohydrolase [Planctomycetota bacterium]